MKSLISILVIFICLTLPAISLASETGPQSGKVAETIDAGSYVYIKLEDGVWIAANSFAVSRGDTIQYDGAMEMNDFHSKALDRSFDSILFVSEASIEGAAPVVKPAPPPGNPHGKTRFDKRVVAKAPVAGEIKALKGGKTIADIYAEADDLNGKAISLNAKVIKVNKSIMGKNWITLQDGTGTESGNKIVATTQELVEPGDIVTVKGTLKTDVDLGRGYHYDVMLEESTFAVGLE